LEVELGPGLLTSIFDGLQNPLEKIAQEAGLFLTRGINIAPLDRSKGWQYRAIAQKGDVVKRGDVLGEAIEMGFAHKIMVPFFLNREYDLVWVAQDGVYSIDEVIAKIKDENGVEYEVKMVQKWPVKKALIEGTRVVAKELMTTGLRIIDTQMPVVKGGTFCTPGPFGAGKTVLQHHLAKFSSENF